ncbi:heat-inducible transcriptional repressor HrcA [Virgibacillus sediminis]|uniref:Heat-inducible transcription repressor HrcA n=1 Tax=Virgibacillus sediminis TaxID=202260 RepID=A0ABV7A635_9BACI
MLTERQLLILQVIIDDFIETAHPVGSRAISKKDDITYSAATIRNEMADLEDMGYLEKTHSSSGRVPSEKGYRYYVDHLIKPASMNEGIKVIRNFINEGFFEFEQLVQTSAEVLSELTNYTSIILGPELVETKLKQLQIVTLSQHTAVAILITNTGHVEHRTFSVPAEINPADLEKMVNILNERLQGVPLINLPDMFNAEINLLMRSYLQDYEKSHDYLKAIFQHDHPVKLYIGGKSNILMQPEFNDVEKIRAFYSLMEQEEEIASLLKKKTDGLNVSIGTENPVDAIKDLSLITSAYHLGEGQVGTIALLGPTRMEYRKVITLMNVLSNEMTDAFYKWYQKND